MNLKRCLMGFLLSVPLLLSSGCSLLLLDDSRTERGASSSLVDFLYPKGEMLPEKTSKARLNVPMRVGIGFVPGAHGNAALTEQDRERLLQKIKAEFAEREYVHDIVIIPQTYLKGKNGPLVVEQLGRLYQLDVLGLVSYDQTVVSELRDSSLLYWTILGAYVVKGNSNTASTFVDLAVVDVKSTKLLLRAGGIHQQQKNATFSEAALERRKIKLDGFAQATNDLLQNFSVELDSFEASIQSNDQVEVVRRGGVGGGSGALGLELVLLLLMAGISAVRYSSSGRAV